MSHNSFGQVYSYSWPNKTVWQVDPKLDLEAARAPVPHWQYPSAGLWHPAEDLVLTAEEKEQKENEQNDGALVEVKLESAPAFPLTKHRRNQLALARKDADWVNGKPPPGSITVAERMGVVDLTV